jgi:hypothetical protein
MEMTMTLENTKTGNTKIRKITMLSTTMMFLALIVLTTNVPTNAYAADCIATYGQHCYAVHRFTPTSTTYAEGVKSTYNVIDQLRDGWVSSPTWAHINDGNFIEIGWIDASGSGGHPQFYCALNGNILSNPAPWGNPSNNTSWTFTVYDGNHDMTWDLIGGFNSCQSTRNSSTAWKVSTGYEITRDTNVLAKNDYSNLQVQHSGTWANWSSSVGGHGVDQVPSSKYYVLYCGTSGSAENYYHSQHGSVPKPSSCT